MSVVEAPVGGGVGTSARRPDGPAKVQGQFAFSSDVWAEGALWGRTLRSTVAAARIVAIDTTAAWAVPGVRDVITAEHVPGAACYGMEEQDQPVFASGVIRHVGEPLAAVAADDPEAARRAMEAIRVELEVTEPRVDPERWSTAPLVHPNGNLYRELILEHGDPDATGDVVVEGTYEVGMQDQAFLGPEAGLAIPLPGGGLELHVPAQWLHADRPQIAACLGLEIGQVHLVMAGVGGAFGAREDVSFQVHIGLLALRTGRPVKVVYSREESFLGHVHRHPARMRYRHHADRTGRLVKVEADLLLDGGAYRSSSGTVISNAVCFGAGPYRVPNARIVGRTVRTNNPPCGAMRGFGAVQVCFAYEAQMDKLAAAVGLDPVELRRRNAVAPGDELVTGQVITGAAPVAELIDTCAAAPLPAGGPLDGLAGPGGTGRTGMSSRVRRGVGFAIGFKNLMFSEGYDDDAGATCRLDRNGVVVGSAAAEVGQGFVTLAVQIAREVLGVERVTLAPVDTSLPSAGSSSASRQSWMSGGAVAEACRLVLDDVVADVSIDRGIPRDGLRIEHGRIRSLDGRLDEDLLDVVGDRRYERTATFHHRPTTPLDARGQGSPHVSFAFAAHRAVVDVDLDLGLVRVVEITTSQDVGRLLNPVQVVGQIEGGIAQGVGLAVMEELVLDGGVVRNPSFTDYLIPTMLDMPDVRIAALIEEPEPGAPFGAKGVGEPPTISSTAAVVAAIRAATGLELPRVPVRPEDIALAP